ncbi:hypothetical protein ACJBQ6_10875, partial [Streptococcus suis]
RNFYFLQTRRHFYELDRILVSFQTTVLDQFFFLKIGNIRIALIHNQNRFIPIGNLGFILLEK